MEAVAGIEAALLHSEDLLERAPAAALKQARLILEAVPGHPQAQLVAGSALFRLGDLDAADAVLRQLAETQPHAARVHAAFGALLVATGHNDDAIAALRHAVALQPALPQAWRMLGDLLILADRPDEADMAYAGHLRASVRDPALMRAAIALADDLPVAERLLRAHLKTAPTDVAALRMLAEVATRLGRYPAAEALLTRCLELAPSFLGARHNYAIVLYRQSRVTEAIPHLEHLTQADPTDSNYANLLAAALAGSGDYARAIALYETLIPRLSRQPKFWMSYGHALRTAGRHADAVAAYRTCLNLAPTLGEAWWSLANLKTGTLTTADADRMRGLLTNRATDAEDRFHLHYALGRVAEEAGDVDTAFAAYAEGARLRRAQITYDPDQVTAQVQRGIALFTPTLLTTRGAAGCPDPAPIFVVGLPRSGSTLIEQMLASHPAVEGTMELPEIPNLVRDITAGDDASYPDCLATAPPAKLAEWGASYLARARYYRKTDRPRFIDKLPNNWLHLPLIRLILPNATLIDARRHPMATCFSAFKQHFARGQHYSYDLVELARFYRDYLAMMTHMDAVAPGAVHQVVYEAMVEDTEAELRRLLVHCGLAFDPACLRFHENPRAVRTASSEQVRQPIFRSGLDEWRRYERWLGPLRIALNRGTDQGRLIRTT